MNKIKVLLVALISVFCLSGCVQYGTTFEFKNDGTMDINMLCAVSEEYEEYLDDDDLFSASDIEEYKKDGWEVNEYSSNGYKGYTIDGKNVSIKKFMEEDAGTGVDDIGVINLTKDGKKYTLDWTIYNTEEYKELLEDSEYYDYIEKSGGYMKIRVVLPQPAITSNATSVSADKLTYEWDLLKLDASKGAHIEFELKENTIYGTLGTLAGMAIIAGLVAAFIYYKKKKNAGNMMAANQGAYGIQNVYYNGQQPQQPQQPYAGSAPQSQQLYAGGAPQSQQPYAGGAPQGQQPYAGGAPQEDPFDLKNLEHKYDEDKNASRQQFRQPYVGGAPQQPYMGQQGYSGQGQQPYNGNAPQSQQPYSGGTPQGQQPQQGYAPQAPQQYSGQQGYNTQELQQQSPNNGEQ